MRKRTIAAGTIAALAALAFAAYAVAARHAEAVQSYTGCLKNGKLESLAVGTSPLAPCGAGQTQVRLGGGNVTAVTAGAGLVGGGDGGDLSLAADTSCLQKRVTIAYFPVGRASSLDVDEGLNLGFVFVRCELHAGADFDRADIDLAGALNGSPGSGRLALEVVHRFAEPGAAILSCKATQTLGPAGWHFLKITAIRVASLSNGPLSLP
jgi:hypothetical protein